MALFIFTDLNIQGVSAIDHSLFDEVLIALHRIIRAVDLQSRRLVQTHGLTGSQALILKEVGRNKPITAVELASNVSLSQATITDIVKRFEGQGLLTRERSDTDKRCTYISLTTEGLTMISQTIPLLQEAFEGRFMALKDWEQHQLLYAVQRLATLIDAEKLDTAPLLTSSSVLASPRAVEDMLDGQKKRSNLA